MFESTTGSLESLTAHVRSAGAAAAIAVAAAHLAYVEASMQGKDVTDATARVAEAAAVHVRVAAAVLQVARRTDEARADARRRHVAAVAETVRAALDAGPMSESALVMVARSRGDLVREALRTLLVRGEVARASGGYCLVPARAGVAA